ncbi:MAG: hypothetical protein WB526_01290 [Candidatus Cybelea sp.]
MKELKVTPTVGNNELAKENRDACVRLRLERRVRNVGIPTI